MTPLVFLALALAGGLGAGSRFVLDGLIRSRVTSSYPLATLVINITGSFLLGLATGLTLSATLAPEVQLIVGAGFLGGYTTFSTASVESVRLVREGRYGVALVSSVGMLVGAVIASAAGLLLGGL
ncbi:CrcB protein [Mycetocola sp. CAN_C7]|uniref:fluoride efflux transporter CrcB n=1 Tax=Mycetocola sp. CAN_C7 TaxID=2787724 RepID=UPI0018CABE48